MQPKLINFLDIKKYNARQFNFNLCQKTLTNKLLVIKDKKEVGQIIITEVSEKNIMKIYCIFPQKDKPTKYYSVFPKDISDFCTRYPQAKINLIDIRTKQSLFLNRISEGTININNQKHKCNIIQVSTLPFETNFTQLLKSLVKTNNKENPNAN